MTIWYALSVIWYAFLRKKIRWLEIISDGWQSYQMVGNHIHLNISFSFLKFSCRFFSLDVNSVIHKWLSVA